MPDPGVGSPAIWAGFFVLVICLLGLDLGLFHRTPKERTMREAVAWTILWIAFAAAFDGFVWWMFGAQKATEFAGGYILEQALSVDNVFVFAVVFTFFGVPRGLQHRVLYWGILGALILRGVFIGLGSVLIHQFHWLMYVFGAILIYTGIKLVFHDDNDVDPNANFLVRLAKRALPVTKGFRGEKFLVKEEPGTTEGTGDHPPGHTPTGIWHATPLLIVLLAIEGTDLLFAVDSIPAVFGISKDPFIIYTSNIFAILGLRSLFFLVSGAMQAFAYLKYGLSAVLVFVGGKMIAEIIDVHVPIYVSLAVIGTLLALAVGASLAMPPKKEAEE